MSRGGARPGAGRRKGVPNRRTAEMLEKASAEGELPLAYMLRVMRDSRVDPKRRDEMARSAAPYCHSKFVAKEPPLVVPAPKHSSAGTSWEELLDPASYQHSRAADAEQWDR